MSEGIRILRQVARNIAIDFRKASTCVLKRMRTASVFRYATGFTFHRFELLDICVET